MTGLGMMRRLSAPRQYRSVCMEKNKQQTLLGPHTVQGLNAECQKANNHVVFRVYSCAVIMFYGLLWP